MGYELPDDLHPETIKFCIEVPNEFFYLQAFWGAMWTLTRPYNHADDDDHTAIEVASVWRDLWFENHKDFQERLCMTECCDDTNDLLRKILKVIEGGFKIVPLEMSLPSDFIVDCTPDNFEGNTDDDETEQAQRTNALCLAVTRWMIAIMYHWALDMNLMTRLDDVLALASMDNQPNFTPKLDRVAQFQTVPQFNQILNSDDGFTKAVCLIVVNMRERGNTFSEFKIAIDQAELQARDDEDDAVQIAAEMAYFYGQSRINYTIFSKELEQSFEDIKNGDTFECPCEPETPPAYCDEALELIVSDDWTGSTGTTITLVAPDIYRIVQNTPAGGGIHYAAIEESGGRCLRFEIPPVEYTYQAATIYNAKGCCDDADSSAVVGDFIGGLFKSVQFAPSGTNPIDTHIKITCEDCCPPLELEDFAGTGTTIQYMGDCIWKFTQSVPDEDDRTYMSFRSILGECLEVENSDRVEFPTQGVGNDTTIVDCDDVESNFTGGFTPGILKSAHWHGANPTYFKIRPQ